MSQVGRRHNISNWKPLINCLAQFSSRLCFIFYRYGDKAPKSKMGRIFSVMATLVGLVSIAVLLGNLTTSLTTDIVFSDIKLYGSKVITRNLVFFFFRNWKKRYVAKCGTFVWKLFVKYSSGVNGSI